MRVHQILSFLVFGPVLMTGGTTNGGGDNGPVVSCDDEKKKILCLPKDYSKFDLPYRNEFNHIDIGESFVLY